MFIWVFWKLEEERIKAMQQAAKFEDEIPFVYWHCHGLDE
jgi:hypothetical protein